MANAANVFIIKLYFRNVNDSTVYIVLFNKYCMIVSINEQMLDTAVGGGKTFDSYFLHWIFACGECQLIILLKLKFSGKLLHTFDLRQRFWRQNLVSMIDFDWMINSINDQKILNHFFFLFIFCLVWGWPLPGGWGPIWTIEAGARLEVVSCDEGEEKPANETGPGNKDQASRY